MDIHALTRRRHVDRPDVWAVYCGDICAGRIARSESRPEAREVWDWSAGFYPGSRPGECTSGSTHSFESAREEFERAWIIFASNRTAEDFQAWRDERDTTLEKYGLRDGR